MNSFGLYLHIPYCIKKCPYCDFNSYAVNPQENKAEERYTAALISELENYSQDAVWNNRKIHSIFFGGGTPSLFSPNSIKRIINSAKSNFSFLENIEITLEANPGTIQEELGEKKLLEFRNSGINRISMGVQGFNEEKLKFLGRLHSKEDVVAAVENIKKSGFDNFNLDLIFGVAEETLDSWQNDLEKIISLKPKHISAYCLTIESGTDFGKLQKKGQLRLLEEDIQAKMFELTQSILLKSNYQQYEISNYSLENFECQHNLGYWKGLDYLGLGAGAHSYYKEFASDKNYGKRWKNIPHPEDYIKRANTKQAAQNTEEIDIEKARLEYLFLAFRTKLGFDLDFYRKEFKQNSILVLDKLSKDNLIEQKSENIFIPTNKGLLFVDEILKELV